MRLVADFCRNIVFLLTLSMVYFIIVAKEEGCNTIITIKNTSCKIRQERIHETLVTEFCKHSKRRLV